MIRLSPSLILRALCALCIPALAAPADGPPRPRHTIDTEGRDLLNYPPHRAATVERIRLELSIPDMNTPTLRAHERITLSPTAADLAVLTLNAAGLDIESMRASSPGPAGGGAEALRGGGGFDVAFTLHPDTESISITLDPPLPLGQHLDLDIAYTVTDPPEGLFWTPESPGHPAQIYTQGEEECNRYWFIGPDSPNQRLSTELIIDVPAGYTVCANGRLASHTKLATGMERFDWVQDRPHAMYLVTFVVGKFDIVDVGSDRLPLPVYVAPGQADRVRATFGRTPDMVRLFERLIDQPYPWPKYAQLCVSNFGGGMENTSATNLTDTTPLDKAALLDGDQDDLISHELAHQWFGDLVTCKSWEHTWLNEGFATYFEKLWAQYRSSAKHLPRGRGPGPGTLAADNDAYQWSIWTDFQAVIDADHAEAPFQPPMVSKEYRHPDETFDREANPYPKGSSVLHMLRERLGDDVFFRGLASYLDRYKDSVAETFDLRRELERVSGLSLQRFFHQWCDRPGVPAIDVEMSWDSAASELTLNFAQTQPINPDNPAFEIDAPIWIRCAGAGGDDARAGRPHRVHFDTRTHTLRIPLPAEPAIVAIDPDLAVLADWNISQPIAWTIAQLESGPTLASRLLAAQTMSASIPPDRFAAIEPLMAAARDEHAFHGLRETALDSLRHLANPADEDDDSKPARPPEPPVTPPLEPSPEAAAALIRLATEAKIADARVRRELLQALAESVEKASETTRARVAAMLTHAFEADPSYAVRAEAIAGLGKLRLDDATPTILTALKTDSQHDQIRRAAAKALATLSTPAAFEIVLRLTEPDNSAPVRAQAAKTLAKLAAESRSGGTGVPPVPERAAERLADLALDRDPRVASAAVTALGKIDDPRAATALERLAAELPGRSLRALAARTLEDSREK